MQEVLLRKLLVRDITLLECKMTITRSNLYIESDNLWRVDGLINNLTGSYINKETIMASVCEDTPGVLAEAISDLGV